MGSSRGITELAWNQLSLEDGLCVEDSDEAAGAEAVLLPDSAGFDDSFDSAGLDSDAGSDDESELLGA